MQHYLCDRENKHSVWKKRTFFFSLTFDSTAEIRIYPHHEFKLKKKESETAWFCKRRHSNLFMK